MRLKRRRNILDLHLWILAAMLSFTAESGQAASLFSLNFIGERAEAADARVIALGGATQIIPDSLGVLQFNPAMLTFCRKVTIGATQVIAVDKGRSSTTSEREVSVYYPVFVGAFPLHKRVTFSIGYRGRSDPDGSFSIPGITEGGVAYRQVFEKSGGLYAVPITLALSVTRYISIAGTYTLEKGSIEDRWTILFDGFDDPTKFPSAGRKRVEMDASGFGAGIVLFPGGPVMVGATYESEIEYDADIKERFSQSSLDTNYTATIKLPQRYSVAATFRITPAWHVLASYAAADFKDFRGLNFPQDRLYQEESYAFGAEYTRGLPLFRKRFPIRFSFNYQRLPYDFPSGQRIRKILFGLGTGLNIAGGKAKMDIALRIGKAGSLSKNTIEDRLVRFYISVTGSEIWKRKRHEDS